jgi:predicted HAD superfamily Cof-like phosphohydrolase
VSTLIEDIEDLTTKYGFDAEAPTLKKLNFRYDLLNEELEEVHAAINNGQSEEVVDGLIDLTVVALGTLAAFGVNIEEAWNEVHRANMSKVRGVKPGREHSGGFDLVKPDGWRAPDHCGNTGWLETVFAESAPAGC